MHLFLLNQLLRLSQLFLCYIVATIFYQWIKRLRWDRRLTQEGLAELLGVDVTTVQRWERGKHQPRQKHMYQLQQLSGEIDLYDEDLDPTGGIPDAWLPPSYWN